MGWGLQSFNDSWTTDVREGRLRGGYIIGCNDLRESEREREKDRESEYNSGKDRK